MFKCCQKLQSEEISQFMFQFFCYLSILLPNKQFCSCTLKFYCSFFKLQHVVAASEAICNSSQLLGLLLQYSQAAVRCSWRQPLLGPELALGKIDALLMQTLPLSNTAAMLY